MLKCAYYTETGDLDVVVRDLGPDVFIDYTSGTWGTKNDFFPTLRIGRDIRIPNAGENRQFWGPAFVFEDRDPEQRARKDGIKEDLQAGCLR